MKAKKVIATLLAASMAMGLMTGCGSSKQAPAEDSSSTKENGAVVEQEDGTTDTGYVDVEFWTTNNGFQVVEKDGVMYNFYKDNLGVGIIQDQYVEWNGGTGYQDVLNLKIASGEIPDIFTLVNGMENDLIKEGALLDLTDYLQEYAPHLWAAIPEATWERVRQADPTGNGGIYYIPQTVNFTRHGAIIRQDWLDKLSLEMPTTQDEFVEVLRAFKNQDPNGNGVADELPTGGRAEVRWMDYLFSMYGIAMWEGYPQWDVYNGELTYSAVTDNMRDALEFVAGLYSEGLLDPETLLNDKAAWDGKVRADKVGVYFQWEEQTYLYATDTYAALNVKPEWVCMPAINADGYDSFYTMMPTASPAFAVANTEDLAMIKSCLKVLDAYADPDLVDVMYLGPEGMWSERNAAGELKRLPEDYATQENMIVKPVDTIANVDAVLSALDLSMTENDAWAVEQSMQNVQDVQQYGKVIAGDGIPSSIYNQYPDIQSRTLYIEYASKIIAGEWPIEKFDEFVEKWYSNGGQEVTQTARDWYASVTK